MVESYELKSKGQTFKLNVILISNVKLNVVFAENILQQRRHSCKNIEIQITSQTLINKCFLCDIFTSIPLSAEQRKDGFVGDSSGNGVLVCRLEHSV